MSIILKLDLIGARVYLHSDICVGKYFHLLQTPLTIKGFDPVSMSASSRVIFEEISLTVLLKQTYLIIE